MANEFNVAVKLQADASQYTAEFTKAGQTAQAFNTQLASSSATAGAAVQAVVGDLQAVGTAASGANTASAALDKAAQSARQVGSAVSVIPQQLQGVAAQFQSTQAGLAGVARQGAAVSAAIGGAAPAAQALGTATARAGAQAAAGLQQADKQAQNLGISAKQTAAAMRGVPAQITDIVVGLQGGQAPLTVLLQQGGQLKDMFGGTVPAVRALSTAVMGMVNPFTLTAAAAAVALLAYKQGSTEADGYRAAIVMSGNAAGTSVGQLSDMARAISQVTGTQGAAAAALTQMAGSGAIARENLQQFASVAMGLERYVGVPVKATVQDLEQLGKAPLAASIKLNEQYHYLTVAVYEQIKALDEQGKKEEAGAVAQQSYAAAMEARKNEIVANLGYIERAWGGVTGAAKGAWDAMLNVGRASTDEQNLAQLRENLTRQQERNGNLGIKDGQATLELKEQIRLLEKKITLTNDGATAQAESAKLVQSEAEWTKVVNANKTKEKQQEAEITRIRNAGAAAGKEQLEIEREVAAYRAKNADKGAAGAAARDLERQRALLAELAGLSSTFYKDWEGLNKQFKAGKLTTEQLTQEQEKLLSKQPGIKKAREDELKVLQAQYAVQQQIADELAQAAVAQDRAVQSGRAAVAEYAKGVDEATRYLEVERNTVAGTASQRALAVELLRIQIDLEKQLEAIKSNQGFEPSDRDEQTAKAHDVAARARLNATSRAEIDHVRELRDELQRTTEQYEQGLVNAAMQGGKSLKEYIQGILRTTAFRIVLQPVMNLGAQALTAVTGSASGTGGAGGILGMASNASSLYSAVSGNGIIGNAASTVGGWLGFGGAAASGLGLSAAAGAGTTLAAAGSGLGLAGSAAGAGYGLTAAGTGLGLSAGSAGAGAIGAGLGTSAAAGGTAAAGAGAGITGALAAIPVWGWALAAVAVLGSMLSKKKTLHTGSGAVYSEEAGLQEGAGVYNMDTFGMGTAKQYNGDTQGLTRGIATGLGSTLDGLAKAFGQKAGFEVATAFADDTSKDGAWGSLRISQGGVDLLDWENTRKSKWAPREFSDGEEGQKEYLAAIAQDTRQVLLDMDLPSWADTLLNSIGDVADMDSLSTAVAQIGKVQTAFVDLGKTIDGFAGLSDKAFEALMAASGGIDALSTSAAAFYANDAYYSEAERTAKATQMITDELAKYNVALPASGTAYRALLEEQLAAGEGGAALAARMLQLQGVFATVTAATGNTAAALQKQVDDQRSAALKALERSVSAEKQALQARLDIAQDVASTLSDLFSILHDNVRELYGEMDATKSMQAREGNDFIAQALAIAKASGYLPDTDRLAEAIAAARSGLDVSNFGGDSAERDYAANLLAGRLAGLEKIAGKQMTDAQKTVRELEVQTGQLDQTLANQREQIDIANGTYEGILSVAEAVDRLTDLQATGKQGDKPGGGGGGGGSVSAGGGAWQRADYGADEALGSFDKFSTWYNGLRGTANTGAMMDGGYEVPDWMRVSHMAGDGTDKEMFGQYQFFKNNPQYAKDYEQIMTSGRSSYSTDGSTLVRSDLSKMPEDVAAYYKNNTAELLSAEGFGLDPVLVYQLYRDGPERFGLDRSTTSFTEWLRTNQWTAEGLVAGNNMDKYASMDYAHYNLTKWDTTSGNLVGRDGIIYSPDGKPMGNATSAQMQALYGSNNTATAGNSKTQDYYTGLRQDFDRDINDGKSAQYLVEKIRDGNTSMQDIATAYGISVDTLKENLSKAGAIDIPRFAGGGNHAGGLRIVGEEGWEVEATGPSRIWNQRQLADAMGSGSNGQIEALVQLLTAELRSLKKSVDAGTANSGDMTALLRDVKNGNAWIVQFAPV